MKMIVADIRVKLASGLYDKRAAWTNIKESMTWETFSSVADYSLEGYEDVRADLKQRIEEVEVANGIYRLYQSDLQKEYAKAEAAELQGNKHYPFAEHKAVLDELLETSIGKLPTVSVDELKKFYLI
jgi:hypothetical protein